MILLDTHILLLWQDEPERLRPDIRKFLADTSEPVAISSITCWEIALLQRKKRIYLPRPYPEWMREVIDRSKIILLEINMEVLAQEFYLPEYFHNDPADRLIGATSIAYRSPLVTMDRKLLSYNCR